MKSFYFGTKKFILFGLAVALGIGLIIGFTSNAQAQSVQPQPASIVVAAGCTNCNTVYFSPAATSSQPVYLMILKNGVWEVKYRRPDPQYPQNNSFISVAPGYYKVVKALTWQKCGADINWIFSNTSTAYRTCP